jgi:putative hydrolase of the HAD superfamily
VVISEEVGAAKPDRRIFVAASRNAGCLPADCVYVGDRLEDDAFGSRAAGFRAIWLTRRSTQVPHGVETIDSLVELPNRLGLCSASATVGAARHIA